MPCVALPYLDVLSCHMHKKIFDIMKCCKRSPLCARMVWHRQKDRVMLKFGTGAKTSVRMQYSYCQSIKHISRIAPRTELLLEQFGLFIKMCAKSAGHSQAVELTKYQRFVATLRVVRIVWSVIIEAKRFAKGLRQNSPLAVEE